MELLDGMHYELTKDIVKVNDFKEGKKAGHCNLDFTDILYSIINHSLVCLLPSTDILIKESKDIIINCT